MVRSLSADHFPATISLRQTEFFDQSLSTKNFIRARQNLAPLFTTLYLKSRISSIHKHHRRNTPVDSPYLPIEQHHSCPLGLWMNLEFDLIQSFVIASLDSWNQHDSMEIALLRCLTETSVFRIEPACPEIGFSIPSLLQCAEIALSNYCLLLAESVNYSTEALFHTLLRRSEGSFRREVLILANSFNLPPAECGLDNEVEQISREMPRIGTSIFELSKLGSLISRVSLCLNNTNSK